MCTIGTTATQPTAVTTAASNGGAAAAPTPTTPTQATTQAPAAKTTSTLQAVNGANGGAVASGATAAVQGATQVPGNGDIFAQLKTLLEALTKLLAQLSPSGEENGGPSDGCSMHGGSPAQAGQAPAISQVQLAAQGVAKAAQVLTSNSNGGSSTSSSASQPSFAPAGPATSNANASSLSAAEIAVANSLSGSLDNENSGTGIFGGNDATGAGQSLPGLGSGLPGSILSVTNFLADSNDTNSGSFV